MAHTAPMNSFGNTSGPNLDINYGNKSKFTPDQTKERIKIHALAVATGYPTYKQILEGWKERFNIDISEQSEKEWRKANKTKILMKKQELIDLGEIEIPIISDKVLADNLNVLVTSSCGFNKQLKESAIRKLKDLEGAKIDASNLEEVKVKIAVFNAIMSAYDKTTTAIVKSFEKMSDLSGRAKMTDAKASHEEETRLLEAPGEEDDFDPTAVEISDEDRNKLK